MTRLSHHSKSKVGRRRSQLALKKRLFTVCSVCKGPTLPHKVCMQCGAYLKKEKKEKTTSAVAS
ncbi:MAG: 50S ribosomal protein L32 [Patescibacteria group bacterium]